MAVFDSDSTWKEHMFDTGRMNTADLEGLRRSLAMSAPDGPATALRNADAVVLVGRVQQLESMRDGVERLLSSVRASRENRQLRAVLAELAALVRQVDDHSRP